MKCDRQWCHLNPDLASEPAFTFSETLWNLIGGKCGIGYAWNDEEYVRDGTGSEHHTLN